MTYLAFALLAALVALVAALYYVAHKIRMQLVEIDATLKKLGIDTIKVGNEQVKGLVEITRNTYRMRL